MTEEILDLARELHRLRVLHGDQKELRHSIAEVAFLAHYGRAPKIGDYEKLSQSLRFSAKDRGGQRLRVVWRQDYPFRVYSYNLDADVYAFVQVSSPKRWKICGWLPIQQVEEAPIWWWVEDGERKAYAHEIEPGWLRPLPEDFVFAETCRHNEDFGMVWNDNYDAWECFGCDQYVLNAHDRLLIARLNDGDGDQIAS